MSWQPTQIRSPVINPNGDSGVIPLFQGHLDTKWIAMSDLFAAQFQSSAFYNEHARDRIQDFVKGNPRIEAAWRTLAKWAPLSPRRVLEVGCGIGWISWRMALNWPSAFVLAIDISDASIAFAQQLFKERNLEFRLGSLSSLSDQGDFDLIVLMDVYEHIPTGERSSFHSCLRRLLSDSGTVVLSFPTPRHQVNLRTFQPELVQPIDEDIDLSVVLRLAEAISAEVLLYKLVSIWHEGDYAHAVLGRGLKWRPIEKHGGIQKLRSVLTTISKSRRLKLFLYMCFKRWKMSKEIEK